MKDERWNQFSVDFDLDNDLLIDVDLVVQTDVVVGLELFFRIVVFVNDRFCICSNLSFFCLLKHKRCQISL